MESLVKRLAEKKIGLVLSPEAKKFLIDVGWDPVYGARPLKRAIQKYVQDPVAMQLLEGTIAPGTEIEMRVTPGGERLEPAVREAVAAGG
jgi:ATP-dependent Clp protease ATP-binding subunit ClpB